MKKLIPIVALSAFIITCNNNTPIKSKSPTDSSLPNKTMPEDSSMNSKSSSTTLPSMDANSVTSVRIGNQEWTTKNLDVTTYRNGDVIQQAEDASKWARLTSGAWCYYDNDSTNNVIYGKLYNWYAVADPRGLAPVGWHIPADSEWATLINFLGGDSVAGNKMKATILWYNNKTGATNESGFSALAGGYRLDNGKFATIRSFGNWWSSTKARKAIAWDRILYSSNGIVLRGDDNMRFGLSIRCIKDTLQ